MAFDKNYYNGKKQQLQQRNQKATQKFLGDTMAYAQSISEIEKDFQDILQLEQEQTNEKMAKEHPEVIKDAIDKVVNRKK